MPERSVTSGLCLDAIQNGRPEHYVYPTKTSSTIYKSVIINLNIIAVQQPFIPWIAITNTLPAQIAPLNFKEKAICARPHSVI
jgi:hypothetical protein